MVANTALSEQRVRRLVATLTAGASSRAAQRATAELSLIASRPAMKKTILTAGGLNKLRAMTSQSDEPLVVQNAEAALRHLDDFAAQQSGSRMHHSLKQSVSKRPTARRSCSSDTAPISPRMGVGITRPRLTARQLKLYQQRMQRARVANSAARRQRTDESGVQVVPL